jgi:hypothetical protein
MELDSTEVKAALRKEVGDSCLVDWEVREKCAEIWIREK